MNIERSFSRVNAVIRVAFLLLALSPLAIVQAQTAAPAMDPKLTVDRIFNSAEFRPERFGGFDWLKDGDSYAKFEPSEKVKGAMDLVRYQIDTEKRDRLLPAEKLIPKGEKKPLEMDGHDMSAAGKQALT